MNRGNTMKKLILVCFAVLLIVMTPSLSHSQFYKVYEYTTPDAGELELVYWTSYVPSSDQNYDFFDKSYSREGLFAHSFEIEYGLSNNLTVAAYVDYEKPKDSALRRTRMKAVMAHYSMYEKGSRPIDIALYFEYILPREGYKDSEEIEFKTILEKDIKNFTVTLNPTFEKKVSGDVEEGIEFNFAGGLYYKGNLSIIPGIEFYSRLGELRNSRNFNEQKGYIFPTVDLFFMQYLHLHLGAGFGLSDNSDNVVLKSIFSFEY